MRKDKFNSKLREYVRNNISPTEINKQFISDIYDSFEKILDKNCLQIGSYPRFTAIRPLHDLDILYILGIWKEQNHNPQELLEELLSKMKKEYSNPTNYKLKISLQSHSVTVIFKKQDKEYFSVDIVPAYSYSKNEFNDNTYKVPQIIRKRRGKNRTEFYKKLAQGHKEMDWLASDPRGYIEIAKRINKSNDDFRKTVKFIKAWKKSCKNEYENFKLKSFHIEQIIAKYFQENIGLGIFDSIFKFFVEIPNIIETPKIKDRANNNKYIDEYLDELSNEQRKRITQARDCFLNRLEDYSEADPVDKLLESCFFKRFSDSEQYLFDFSIPTLIDDKFSFRIYGEVQERKGFRKYILDKLGSIVIGRRIKFRVKEPRPNVDQYKWKVKNDNNSSEPRGEITDNQTKNDPENTKYAGDHYVECYAILNSVCVSKAKQNVKL